MLQRLIYATIMYTLTTHGHPSDVRRIATADITDESRISEESPPLSCGHPLGARRISIRPKIRHPSDIPIPDINTIFILWVPFGVVTIYE